MEELSSIIAGNHNRGVTTMFDQSQVLAANRTCRSRGAVGARAVVPAFVGKLIPEVDARTVLDFGAGRDAIHAQALARQFPELFVDAWEFGENFSPEVHTADALVTRYDVVYASNVLNVQGSQEMLDVTLDQLANCCALHGNLVVNLPASPRKGAWDGMGGMQARNTLYMKLLARFMFVQLVNGSTSAPVFHCSLPFRAEMDI